MTITLQAVNELIASLESAGELSIREQKFLKLAKAFKQLAAENVALKAAVPEPRNVEFDNDSLDDVSLAEDFGFNDAIGKMKINMCKTPATERIVAEAEARGVEKAIAHLEKKFSNIGVQIMNLQWLADSLREGASE
ncbi:hypothetical protein [Klebsiella pneumoniae]|uniref:hypothetical protein n=1 Tax=Klebsiella pneumoniae TaxID=573 RepID=UPI00224778F6|nr:hypothetical protein [Klebsiella pneumoniae]MCW9304126.1 hypothetical protein [Klebsiella pneumoniae]